MNTLGQELKLLRGEHQWSQSQAAKAIGIEQSYLSKLESDQSWASMEVLQQICKTYGTRPISLLQQVNLDSLNGNVQYQGLLAKHKRQRQGFMTGMLGVALTAILWFGLSSGIIKLPGQNPALPFEKAISLNFEEIPAEMMTDIFTMQGQLKLQGSEHLKGKFINVKVTDEPWMMAVGKAAGSIGLKITITDDVIELSPRGQAKNL